MSTGGRAGFTLIELMITVAMLSVSAVVLQGAASSLHRDTGAVVLRERALLLLEHEAEAVLAGRDADPVVRAGLLADLPGGALAPERSGELVRLVVTWRSPRGRAERRELAVVAPR